MPRAIGGEPTHTGLEAKPENLVFAVQAEGELRRCRAVVVSHGGAHVLKLSAERYRRLVKYYPELIKIFTDFDQK